MCVAAAGRPGVRSDVIGRGCGWDRPNPRRTRTDGNFILDRRRDADRPISRFRPHHHLCIQLVGTCGAGFSCEVLMKYSYYNAWQANVKFS
jgi:hypothetical protein